MVLRTHVTLHPLTGLTSPAEFVNQTAEGFLNRDKPLVNVLASSVASNETDGLDIRMVTDRIDCGNASVDDVDDTRR